MAKGVTLACAYKVQGCGTMDFAALLNGTVGKVENACNQNFLLLSQCFQLYEIRLRWHLICRLQMFSVWCNVQFCHLGKN